MPDIISSNDFENAALFWLYREIKRLDLVMKSIGLEDHAARREICENLFFGTEDGLTRSVTTMDGQQFTPKLLFISNDGQQLQADRFDFHEYAGSIVDEYYEDAHAE